MRLFRLSRFSVRARIARARAYSGGRFAAIGAVYQTGAREVNEAFDSVRQAAALADASRELKHAVASLGAVAQEFAAGQRAIEAKDFADAHASALVQAETIGRLGGTADPAELGAIRRIAGRLKTNFDSLVLEREQLGRDDTQGLQATLAAAAASAEKSLAGDVAGFPEADLRRLALLLPRMRRHQAEFMWRATFSTRQGFADARERMYEIIDKAAGDDASKKLRAVVKVYADAFRQYVEGREAMMSAIATSVAAAVEEQTATVASIAVGVNGASAEARSGAAAMARVAAVSAEARSTGGEVKALAETLAAEAESLESGVRQFLTEVRAA